MGTMTTKQLKLLLGLAFILSIGTMPVFGEVGKTVTPQTSSVFSSVDSTKVSSQDKKKILEAVDWLPYVKGLQLDVKRNWHPHIKKIGLKSLFHLTLDKNGNLIDCKLKQSSGDKVFDNEALKAIQQSSPFDPLPGNYTLPTLELDFSVGIYKPMSNGGIQSGDSSVPDKLTPDAEKRLRRANELRKKMQQEQSQ